MEKSAAINSTPVPPYESNPQYEAPPPAGQYGQQQAQPMTHQDSFHINQVPSQGQYHQPPISPQGEIKPEGSYYAGPQHPGMGQQQPSQPQVVVLAQGQQQPQQPNQQQYHTSTPIQSLGEGPAPVDCPSCRTRTLTRTQYVSGNTTMGWAAVICFCFCLGCIPFLMRGLKDVDHNCGNCGIRLATWHNSGRTVVHAHG